MENNGQALPLRGAIHFKKSYERCINDSRNAD